MYDRVIFPTDGSDAADRATEHAIALADRFDATLHLLYVVETPSIQATDAFATSDFEATREAMVAEGTNAIEAVTDRAEQAGVEITSEVEEGQPAPTIVKAADEGDAIVVGTHGRSGLDRYLIGSTTEKVVRTADVPVLTVPLVDDDADQRD